jgi:peptidoglycan/LPS O-acetylase OafA/YrhL
VLSSVFDSGAVYYPTILVLPLVTGAALAIWRPDRRGLWILVAVVAAFILFDVALDDTRFDDLPFFVVLGLFMVGLGLLARWVATRLRPRLGPTS